MAPINYVAGLAGISASVGLALLVVSSISMDDIRKAVDNVCVELSANFKSQRDSEALDIRQGCKMAKHWLAAAAIGIASGIIQIAALVVALLDGKKVWAGIHAVIVVMCAAAFGIMVDNHAFDYYRPTEIKALASLALIDMVSALVSGIVMCFL